MPGFSIHIAVGNRYLKKNKLKDEDSFKKGLVAPDLLPDSKKVHYGEITSKDNIVKYLENKVLLNKYLEENTIASDYDKGYFLHLITDYLFFNSFISKSYLMKHNYEEFCQDLYFSYDQTDEYVKKKYKIDYSEYEGKLEQDIAKTRKDKKVDKKEHNNILMLEDLDAFIEKVSNINLDSYAKKIKEYGKNIIPN